MRTSDVKGNTGTKTFELERIIDLARATICSNTECEKVFEKTFVLTDLSTAETYHACPHCLSRVEIDAKAECQHYFGYLKKIPKSTPIPDECLTCPKITQCLFNYYIGRRSQ